jgi:hypothetical protein
MTPNTDLPVRTPAPPLGRLFLMAGLVAVALALLWILLD